MYGGILLRKSNIRDDFINQNIYQDMYQNKIQTESKGLLNKNQIFNTKNQSADYLIEYFEGMILNYISLYEEQGIRNDKLKNFILSHDKNKFKGGDGDDEDNDEDNVYIKNHDTYKYYKKDEYIKDEDILKFSEDNWKKINIEINIDYQKEYNIYIKHNNNGLNKIDLIIDLHHDTIIDNKQRSYNNALCDSTKNISYILSQIIKLLIKYICRNEDNKINYCIYDGKKNVIETELTFKIVISLLIMILTLKNGTDEKTYKKYNTTYLLSGIYQKLTSYNEDIYGDNSFDKFRVNNINLLTYTGKENHIIKYGGDCALNVLMCVKKEDLRELFVDKISFSQNKFVKKEKKESKYYVNKINEILDELSTVKKFDYIKNNIKNSIERYDEFVNFINKEYLNFRNAVINKKYIDIDKEYRDKFESIYGRCIEFVNIFRNNLLDYNNFEEIEKIFNKLDNVKNMQRTYENENYKGTEEIDKLMEGIMEEINEKRRKEIEEKKESNEWNNDMFAEMVFKYEEEDASLRSKYAEKVIYDHSGSLRIFIEIVDVIIKYKDSLNIFYINLLITLLLTKYKINYIFDTNIMKILKYSKNKIDTIKCFRNVCYNENRNEFGIGLPAYQKGDGEDKYLFKYICIKGMSHAVILIININTNNDKVLYLYDINNLNMYCIEKYDINHKHGPNETFKIFDEYSIDNKSPRWIIKKYNLQIAGEYKKEIIIFIRNIISNNNIVKSLNKINIFNKNGNFDFDKLNALKYDECNENNFNSVYYNYKKLIFKQLLDYCDGLKNEYIQSPNNDFLYIVNFVNDYINKNIIKYDNNTKDLLYKLIDCLVQCKYNLQLSKGINIDLDEEYKNILKYMTNTYSLAIGRIGNYLNFIHDNNNRHVKFIELIIDVMKKLRFNTKTFEIVYGGDDVNTNCYDSILKKVLIILLVIVIIIIIVLIVLYIINKYKNNKIVP